MNERSPSHGSRKPRGRAALLVLAMGLAPLAGIGPAQASGTDANAPGLSSAPPATFHPLPPLRILDTRSSLGGHPGKVGPNSSFSVLVVGVGGVPSTGVSAVALNVTVTNPTAPSSFLTVYPSDATRPNASNLNFVNSQTVANDVLARVSADGHVRVYNYAGSTHVIFDVVGWYDFGWIPGEPEPVDGAIVHALTPARILDTRDGTGGHLGKIGPNTSITVPVTDVGGVPASGATAVVLNVTATAPTAASFLTVYPAGTTRPDSSSLNFAAGKTVPNLVVAKVGDAGSVALYNSAGEVHAIFDVVGWFGADDHTLSGRIGALSPSRILDTRTTTGGHLGKVGPNQAITVKVTGVGGVPKSGVSAVAVNTTVTSPTTTSYLTVYPADATRPTASNLNFVGGQTVPNLVLAKVSSDGKVKVYNAAGYTHVIFDVVAWSSTTPALNPVVPPASVPSSFTPPKSGSVQVHNTMTPAEIRRYWTPERMAAARPVTPMEQDTYSGRQKAVAQNNAEYGPNEQDLARFTFGYLEPQFSRITGHLFAIDNSGGGALCSASVVARNLLMTAAHCVKDFVDWFFVPGERGDIVHDPDAAPYGFWPSSGAVYEAAFDTIGPPGDVAVIEIPQDPDTQQYIGDVTGFIPPAADSPGGPKFQIGYPIEGWFGDSCGDPNAPPCSPRPCSDTADTDSCFQYYCWSPTGDYTYVAQDPNVSHGYWIEQAIGCPIAGGGSGGPYYEFINGAWALVSVFSHLSYYVLGYDYPPGACPNPRGPNGAQFCVYLNINSWGSYINGKIIADIYTPNVVP